MMKTFNLFLFFVSLACSWVSTAQVVGPSVAEVRFSYSATFVAPKKSGQNSTELAQFHFSHLFGIFQSPQLIQSFGLSSRLVGGIGAPRMSSDLRVLSTKNLAGDKIQIQYQNRGKMLLHRNVAQQLLGKGELHVPLPSNPFDIFDEQCTDSHYSSFGDYWYFYDPFRRGCEHLSRAPLASDVIIQIRPVAQNKLEISPNLHTLRGDNGNGSLFSIFVIHGYSDSSTNRRDDGRRNFDEFNQFLLQRGFEEQKFFVGTTRPMSVFRKPLQLGNGRVDVEVRHLLVNTDIDSRNVSFARFFREAVNVGDVIIYEGHSGLGGNLDLDQLELKAGKFIFPKNKKQIFFFDSCSSYSYYLDPFLAEKTKANIDIISNGLSSTFEDSEAILETFLGYLLNQNRENFNWMEILSGMESTLRGSTFLLNVGGI